MELRSRPKPACRNTYGECNRPKLTYFQYVVHFKGYVNIYGYYLSSMTLQLVEI